MLARIELFETKKEFLIFFAIVLSVFSLNVAYEYYKFSRLTSTKSTVLEAKVLNEYLKSTSKKTYKVIKLKTDDGHIFYTTASVRFRSVKGKRVRIKVWMQSVSFLDYLKGFYTKGWFLEVYPDTSLKTAIAKMIASQHDDTTLARIYQALFLASSLTYELYERFSALGISHLFAISGFHIGILSAVVYFLLSLFYTPLQNHFFPYRSKTRDLFFLTAAVVFIYMHFLGYPPSLVRSFGLMVVGFFLYDRGFVVISMQSLLVAVLLIIAFFPLLLFSLGFWLSVLGVFFIMLFFFHFKALPTWQQFLAVPVWVYLMMLPTSLYIFENFSLWHPISILMSIAFSVFYPLVLFLHLIGFGGLLDPILQTLVSFDLTITQIRIPQPVWIAFLILSFVSVWSKKTMRVSLFFAVAIFSYALVQLIPF